MSKELSMYNPITPIWVAEILEVKTTEAVPGKKAVKAVKAIEAKPAVLDEKGKETSKAVEAVEAVEAQPAVKAVEAKIELITPEDYENIIVSEDFVKENKVEKGMFFYTKAGGKEVGTISAEDLDENYKAV